MDVASFLVSLVEILNAQEINQPRCAQSLIKENPCFLGFPTIIPDRFVQSHAISSQILGMNTQQELPRRMRLLDGKKFLG